MRHGHPAGAARRPANNEDDVLGGEHRRERTALLESASPLEDCLLLVPERSNDRQELPQVLSIWPRRVAG